eukprot:gene6802-9317_t
MSSSISAATPSAILNNEETAKLYSMQEIFNGLDGVGLLLNDNTLLRYLRARNFDVAKASDLLHKTITWRKQFELDQVQNGWKDILVKESATGKIYCRGFDKEGHILMYMRPRLENSRDHTGNIKNLVYNMERAITKAKICMLTSSAMAKPDNAFFRDVDKEVIESDVGGLDQRAFDPDKFLNAPFETEFLSLLT